MKSGVMFNFLVEVNVKNDYLEIIINWGNNIDVIYGGKFVVDICFFKMEGFYFIFQVDINIQFIKVVLNDMVWNIYFLYIVIDLGCVFIDNFLFEYED